MTVTVPVAKSGPNLIAVDTNVLVRLLTGDDPAQAARAAALFAQEHVFIPKSVLLETAWEIGRAHV